MPGIFDRQPRLAGVLARHEGERPGDRSGAATMSGSRRPDRARTAPPSADRRTRRTLRAPEARCPALRPSNPIAASSADASRTVIPAKRRASTCSRSRRREPVSGSESTITRPGSSPHHHALPADSTPPGATAAPGEPRGERSQLRHRRLEHELREIGAVDQADGPDAYSEFGGRRAKVHRHGPAGAGAGPAPALSTTTSRGSAGPRDRAVVDTGQNVPPPRSGCPAL